jgi:protein-disulfide isomerase
MTHPDLSRKAMMRDRRLKRRRQQRINTLLLVAGAGIILALILIVPSVIRAQNRADALRQITLTPVGEIKSITPRAYPQAQGNAMGDPNAPVKIVAYSDFQCPGCKTFSDEVEQKIVDTYISTGKVYFVYRSMGNWIGTYVARTGGTESQDSSQAAYCANDQGKFWEYHDMLYANWLGEEVGSFTPSRLVAFARTLGLDVDAFQSCLVSHKYLDQVLQDYTAGREAGVNSTPSFVVNGKLIVGAGYDPLQQAIEAALAGK